MLLLLQNSITLYCIVLYFNVRCMCYYVEVWPDTAKVCWYKIYASCTFHQKIVNIKIMKVQLVNIRRTFVHCSSVRRWYWGIIIIDTNTIRTSDGTKGGHGWTHIPFSRIFIYKIYLWRHAEIAQWYSSFNKYVYYTVPYMGVTQLPKSAIYTLTLWKNEEERLLVKGLRMGHCSPRNLMKIENIHMFCIMFFFFIKYFSSSPISIYSGDTLLSYFIMC